MGPVGTEVTITGTGFNATPANNAVFFGATQAEVLTASSTELTVKVPPASTYQYISVTDLNSNLTAYSSDKYIVTFENESINFANKMDFPVGFDSPSTLTINDLDGDGKPDLITKIGDRVLVLRNIGTEGVASFASKVEILVNQSNAYAVSVGDLDGDGKPDLAVANYGSNSVTVFLNTSTVGAISFASRVNYTTGNNPKSISIGDLDGDGRPDLAVLNITARTVSVLRNTGNKGILSFAAKEDFTTGPNPQNVSIGDLDGDGMPDLAVTNQGSNTVSVFQNTGSIGTISFAAKEDFTTGTSPYYVTIGDLDGDGMPELAVANNSSATVSVFRNTGSSGTISFAAKEDLQPGHIPRW